MNEIKAKALELSVRCLLVLTTEEYIERARAFEAYLSESDEDAEACYSCEHVHEGVTTCLYLIPDEDHGTNACGCRG
jgi:hypothetical protein